MTIKLGTTYEITVPLLTKGQVQAIVDQSWP